MIADQRDGAALIDPTLAPGVGHGDAHEAGSIAGQFGECAEAEVMPQARALHFGPSDAREVSGDQRGGYAAAGKLIQEAGARPDHTLRRKDRDTCAT